MVPCSCVSQEWLVTSKVNVFPASNVICQSVMMMIELVVVSHQSDSEIVFIILNSPFRSSKPLEWIRAFAASGDLLLQLLSFVKRHGDSDPLVSDQPLISALLRRGSQVVHVDRVLGSEIWSSSKQIRRRPKPSPSNSKHRARRIRRPTRPCWWCALETLEAMSLYKWGRTSCYSKHM